MPTRRTLANHPQGRGQITNHASGLPGEQPPFGPHNLSGDAHVSPHPSDPTGVRRGAGGRDPVTRRDRSLDHSHGFAPEGSAVPTSPKGGKRG